MTGVQRPIFLIGTGRSGTTLTFDLLAEGADLAWFTSLDVRLGPRAVHGRLKRLRRNHTIARLEQEVRPGMLGIPTEPYAILDSAFPGFSRCQRSLTARDVTPTARRRLQELFAGRVAAEGGRRFVLKWTGWSRIGFMSEIFPDASFVHVHRHGLNTAESLLRQSWWDGWVGPERWRWGPLTPAEDELWQASDRSFAVLAALHWKQIFSEIETSRALLEPGRYYRLAMEDLQRSPLEQMGRLYDFLDLPWDAGARQAVAEVPVHVDPPDTWVTGLGPDAPLAERAIAAELEWQRTLATGPVG